MAAIFFLTCKNRTGLAVPVRLKTSPVLSVLGVTAMDDLLQGRLRGAPRLGVDQKKHLSAFLDLIRQFPVENRPHDRHGSEVPFAKRRHIPTVREAENGDFLRYPPIRPVAVHVLWVAQQMEAGVDQPGIDEKALRAHQAMARKASAALRRFCRTLPDPDFFFRRIGVNVWTDFGDYILPVRFDPVDGDNPFPEGFLFVAVNENGGFLHERERVAFSSGYRVPWGVVALGQATLYSSFQKAKKAAEEAWFDRPDFGVAPVYTWTILQSPIRLFLAEGQSGHPLFTGLQPMARQQLDEAIAKDEVRRMREELEQVKKDHPDWFGPAPVPRIVRRL